MRVGAEVPRFRCVVVNKHLGVLFKMCVCVWYNPGRWRGLETGLISPRASAYYLCVEGLWQDLMSDACGFHVVTSWVIVSFNITCADWRGTEVSPWYRSQACTPGLLQL